MRNFYERFLASEERFGARPAVLVQRRDRLDSFTYADLWRMAEQAATWLAARGLKPGDRCALLADNDAHWCAAYLGTLRLGVVAVPFDTAYNPSQLAVLLRDSGAKILFTTPRYLGAARSGVEASGAASEIVLLHRAEAGMASIDDLFQGGPLVPLPPCPATWQGPAVILYTSGTTSDPKGVVLTHGNLLAEIEAVLEVLHLDEGDVVLGVLPLFHSLAQMANLLLPFASGASVVFLESVNTTELLRALQQRDVTAFCCVPQFFYLIHQRIAQELAAGGRLKRVTFRSLLRVNGALRNLVGLNLGPRLFGRVHQLLGCRMRLLVTGGSRFDPGIGRDLYHMGFDILQAYGLSECSGAATVTRPGEKWSETVGKALPGVEVKILPRESVAEAEVRDGEVAIRGPIGMQGYLNRPDATAAVLRDGWLHTGDLGTLDSAGRLTITGRKKEVIVLSSGKNIYPEEIEAHYEQSPYIKEVCVLSRASSDEPSGEHLHAVVVPDFEVMRERKVVNTREILRYEIDNLSLQLASYKRVLSYEVWADQLPRTTTRKLKRFAVERRMKARGEASAKEAAAEARPLSEEEAAWAAEPVVSRALTMIAEAARHKGPIHPDANIELELQLDSMGRVELLTHLQEVFGTQVPDGVASAIYTVRELVEAVRPREGAATTEGARGGTAWSKLLQVSLKDDPALAELLRPRTVATLLVFGIMKCGYLSARLLFRFRVAGRKHLPATGPFLLCPNHQSYLDAFFLASALPLRLFRKLFFVGASEYFAPPFMRWVTRLLRVVPVDPDTNLLRAMRAGAFGLRHGMVLGLFPEGERTIDGQIKKFKKGASILSLHLGTPIVPVALNGPFKVWPRGHRLQGFYRVRMRFGRPLPPPAALSPDASFAQAEAHYITAADQLRDTVWEMWNSLRRPARN
ncbi:MAG: AMP-binding protein [Terriglobia bacterium]